MQFRYLANLKIARLMELLNRVDDDQMPFMTLEHIVRALRHLTELCIRNRMVLWFNHRHAGCIQKISEVGLKQLEAFDGRQMAVMIWTIGKIGGRAFKSRSEQNFCRELLTQCVRRLLTENMCRALSVHESMLLVNGLANLDCTQLGPILDACLPTFTSNLTPLSHEVFSLFLWSYGKLGYHVHDASLRRQLMDECRRRFEDMSIQQMSSIVWGLCRMGTPGARTLLIECLSVVYVRLQEFVPLGIARLIDACYLMNHHPGEAVVKLLSNRFSHFRSYATPALFCQALPAFAYFDGFSDVLFGYSNQAMKEKYNSLAEAEQMVRILAAYAVGDTLSPSFLERTVASLLQQDIYRDLPPALLKELWISIATHRAHYGEIVNRAVPNALLQLAKEAWIREESDRKLPPLTEEILGHLKDVNVTSSSRYCEPEIEIRSDLVCLWESRRVGVFIFDQLDTFTNDSNRLNGHALWRERVFMKMGYGVGRISVMEWDKLKDASSKRAYLLKMLKSHRWASYSRMSRSQMHRIQSVYLNTM